MITGILNGFYVYQEDGQEYPSIYSSVTDRIAINPLSSYVFNPNSTDIRWAFYDLSSNFISGDLKPLELSVTFDSTNIPANAKYIACSANTGSGTSGWTFKESVFEKAYSITYKHKRVDIHIIDFYGITKNIAGTDDLFKLQYTPDVRDKGQTFLTSTAELNIYEDDFFNIDELATSGETDIKVKYYENDLLHWVGFVIPDFFQTDISQNRVVKMLATDRIASLKEVDFNGNSKTAIGIIYNCLLKTGLDLRINISQENLYIDSPYFNLERLESLSAYESLKTLLILYNSKIFQYKNQWWIINKLGLEDDPAESETQFWSYDSGVPIAGEYISIQREIIDIVKVNVSGIRSIKPVASEVSLKLEFGGSRKYPNNWNFQKIDLSTIFKDWSVQPFDKVNTKQVTGYNNSSVQYAEFGQDVGVNSLQYRSNKVPELVGVNPLNFPHKKSSWSTFKLIGNVKYAIDFRINFTSASNVDILAYLLVRKGAKYFVYYKSISGEIKPTNLGTTLPINLTGFNPIVIKSADRDSFGVVQTQWNQELNIDRTFFGVSETETDTLEFQIIIMAGRSYTSVITETDVFINSAELVLNGSDVTGKGLIFKTKTLGSKFTKVRESEEILFSDKIYNGINGFFYNYRDDDTSILNGFNGIALNSVRGRSVMFAKARDFLSLGGKIEINPLARYRCGDKSFVFVSGESRRIDSSIELEEIVENELSHKDYIYTYFD